MLTLAALVYTRLYFSRALRDCSQVCFQLNTLFLPFSFLWTSPALLSPTLQFFEKELLGFWQRPTQSLTHPKGRLKDLVFTTENLSLISLHHFTLSTSFLLTHSLTLSTIHFFLSSPFSINLPSSSFFFTVVIFLSSLYPFFLLFMLVLSFFESVRSYWIFDRGLYNSQPGESERTSLSSLPHPLSYFQSYHVHFYSLFNIICIFTMYLF